MARLAKRLAQSALSSSTVTLYTAPASTTAQVTEVYFANTGTASRSLTVFVNGTYSTNTVIVGLAVNGTSSVIVQDIKIVLPAASIIAAKQDAGTDVICTIFGVEET